MKQLQSSVYYHRKNSYETSYILALPYPEPEPLESSYLRREWRAHSFLSDVKL